MKKNINGDDLRKKALRLDVIGQIYDDLYRNMQWNTMQYTEDTDENGDHIFKIPDQEDGGCYLSQYEKYMIYQEAIAAIEKLATK